MSIEYENDIGFHRVPLYGNGYSLDKLLIQESQASSYKNDFKTNFTSIWIKESNGSALARDCWPGKSHWVDFLNPNAQQFWRSLMKPSFFKSTNSNYSYWIDMNEPSVFNIAGMTVPSDALHYTSLGRAIQHKDVHNMYGALQHKTAY